VSTIKISLSGFSREQSLLPVSLERGRLLPSESLAFGVLSSIELGQELYMSSDVYMSTGLHAGVTVSCLPTLAVPQLISHLNWQIELLTLSHPGNSIALSSLISTEENFLPGVLYFLPSILCSVLFECSLIQPNIWVLLLSILRASRVCLLSPLSSGRRAGDTSSLFHDSQPSVFPISLRTDFQRASTSQQGM
jgi:hypothetical protein